MTYLLTYLLKKLHHKNDMCWPGLSEQYLIKFKTLKHPCLLFRNFWEL